MQRDGCTSVTEARRRLCFVTVLSQWTVYPVKEYSEMFNCWVRVLSCDSSHSWFIHILSFGEFLVSLTVKRLWCRALLCWLSWFLVNVSEWSFLLVYGRKGRESGKGRCHVRSFNLWVLSVDSYSVRCSPQETIYFFKLISSLHRKAFLWDLVGCCVAFSK